MNDNKIKKIAKFLRDRQKKLRLIPKEDIDRLTDDDIINSYLVCSYCNKKFFEKPFKNLKNEYDFIDKVNKELKKHLSKCEFY